MTMRKTCTIVGSDKGGVGKSLLSQIIILAHDQAGSPLNVIEIDNQRTLSNLLDGRVDLSLDASISNAETSKNNKTISKQFESAFEKWAEKDSITDLGANVTSPLLWWMQEQEIPAVASEEMINFRFISVTIPDDQSIRSAASGLEAARIALGSEARLFLLMNDTQGMAGFGPYKNSAAWKKLQKMQETHGVEIIQFPHCESALLEWGRAKGKNILQLLMDENIINEICVEAEFSKLRRREEIRNFRKWIIDIQEALMPIFSEKRTRYTEAA